MVEREQITKLVKLYLPQIEEDVVNQIAQDIVSDVEAIIYSIIRRIVAQKREQIYLSSYHE